MSAVSARDLIRPDRAEKSAAWRVPHDPARTHRTSRHHQRHHQCTVAGNHPSLTPPACRCSRMPARSSAIRCGPTIGVLKMARTLDVSETVGRIHLAEAISYRMNSWRRRRKATRQPKASRVRRDQQKRALSAHCPFQLKGSCRKKLVRFSGRFDGQEYFSP